MKKYMYYSLIIRFIFTIIFIIHADLFAQSDITFHVDDLLAGPAECNWMFETDDDPNCVTHDGNPFTSGGNINVNNFAYRTFTWENGKSGGVCIGENTIVIDDAEGITLKLYGFTLNAFNHINTVNADNNWAVSGQAGDERIYAGGIGEIWDGPDLVLRATNCRLTVYSPYPTAGQMNAVLGGNPFTHDVGSGAAVTGSGWGEIDRDNSADDWKNEFDPNNTGQLDFEITTISAIIQGNYGYYDFDIKVKPTVFIQNLGFADVPALRGTEAAVNIAESDVAFDLKSASSGHGSMRTVLANQIFNDPGGIVPGGINKICNQLYWQIGTTLESYAADLTFDISDINGITNTANLRILKRNTGSSVWLIYDDYILVDETHIKAVNLVSFGEFAIGSTGENALPVELHSFYGSLINDRVILKWITATEINNYGFEIERKSFDVEASSLDRCDWKKIGFVEGCGNSNSNKEYSFTDNLPAAADLDLVNDLILYRLKQIDTDGSFTYSKTITVEACRGESLPTDFELFQNYPNPFNPSTSIKYQISSSVNVQIKLYDILGNEILVLTDEQKEPGIYEIQFTASGEGNINLPSGTYIYSLRAGNFYQNRKMLLLK